MGWLALHGYSYRSSLIPSGRDRNGRGTFCHCGYETGLTYLGDSFIIADQVTFLLVASSGLQQR